MHVASMWWHPGAACVLGFGVLKLWCDMMLVLCHCMHRDNPAGKALFKLYRADNLNGRATGLQYSQHNRQKIEKQLSEKAAAGTSGWLGHRPASGLQNSCTCQQLLCWTTVGRQGACVVWSVILSCLCVSTMPTRLLCALHNVIEHSSVTAISNSTTACQGCHWPC